LLEFGDYLSSVSETTAPEGDRDAFALSDPFAFLVAVLLDQSMPAERAWLAPATIRDRVGHLDPTRLIEQPAKVRTAFSTVPKPYRYPRIGAKWVLAAAQVVVDEYGGDASAIWRGRPSASQLRERLEAFKGIGQKKAAMAVEILARDLKVPIVGPEGSDVAFDIHVRRVFLRARLVSRDRLWDVISAARALNPEHPAALDLPAWMIGRRWCRPQKPICGQCPIAWACPGATAVVAK
jgi:uncharacterized HhH-GPD family protein